MCEKIQGTSRDEIYTSAFYRGVVTGCCVRLRIYTAGLVDVTARALHAIESSWKESPFCIASSAGSTTRIARNRAISFVGTLVVSTSCAPWIVTIAALTQLCEQSGASTLCGGLQSEAEDEVSTTLHHICMHVQMGTWLGL